MVLCRLAVLFIILCGLRAFGAPPPPSTPPTPPEAVASSDFDARVAQDAWLAKGPPSGRARSDKYFEGGYWLILWDFVVGAGIYLLLLETRWSARMRDVAVRLTRFRFLQTFLYAALFSVVVGILSFPLTVYEGYVREHAYGLSNQNFPSWFQDLVIGGVVNLILVSLLFAILLAAVRRFPGTWHLWGIGITTAMLIFTIVVGPLWIAPLFNKYEPLGDQRIKNQILGLARQNGISARDVWQVNASKQSNRVSANVSGLFGTERITLNDNLLARCSPQAVAAVMGHEMGHYVLNHIYKSVLFYVIVFSVLFFVLRGALQWSISRRSRKWGIQDISDPATIPLALLIVSVLGFVATPIDNSWTRTQEYEADIFGLNSARQPDGFAESALLLGEYRKMEPSPVEELIFFDHPSGRTRIYSAMRWKEKNLCLFDAALSCESLPPAQLRMEREAASQKTGRLRK